MQVRRTSPRARRRLRLSPKKLQKVNPAAQVVRQQLYRRPASKATADPSSTWHGGPGGESGWDAAFAEVRVGESGWDAAFASVPADAGWDAAFASVPADAPLALAPVVNGDGNAKANGTVYTSTTNAEVCLPEL